MDDDTLRRARANYLAQTGGLASPMETLTGMPDAAAPGPGVPMGDATLASPMSAPLWAQNAATATGAAPGAAPPKASDATSTVPYPTYEGTDPTTAAAQARAEVERRKKLPKLDPTGKAIENLKTGFKKAGEFVKKTGVPKAFEGIANANPYQVAEGVDQIAKNLGLPVFQWGTGIGPAYLEEKGKEEQTERRIANERRERVGTPSYAPKDVKPQGRAAPPIIGGGVATPRVVQANENILASYNEQSDAMLKDALADVEIAHLDKRTGEELGRRQDAADMRYRTVDWAHQERMDAGRRRAEDLVGKSERLNKELQDMGDPDAYRMFRGVPGLFNSVAAIVGGVLGGVSAARRGGKNEFLETLDNWMRTDFQDQIAKRNNKRAQLSEVGQLFQRNRELMGDDEAATLATKKAIYDGVMRTIEMIGTRQGVDMTDPRIQKTMAKYMKEAAQKRYELGVLLTNLDLSNAGMYSSAASETAKMRMEALKAQRGELMTYGETMNPEEHVERDTMREGTPLVYFADPKAKSAFRVGRDAAVHLSNLSNLARKFKDEGIITRNTGALNSLLANARSAIRMSEEMGASDKGTSAEVDERLRNSGLLAGTGTLWDSDNILDALDMEAEFARDRAFSYGMANGNEFSYIEVPVRGGLTSVVPNRMTFRAYGGRPSWMKSTETAGISGRAAEVPPPAPNKSTQPNQSKMPKNKSGK